MWNREAFRQLEAVNVFSSRQQREFIQAHIPHRLTALLAVLYRQQAAPDFFQGRGDVYCGCIEGSYIMLRVFIEFLGLASSRTTGALDLIQRSRSKGKGQRAISDTDVMLDCFGLPLVDPGSLGADKMLLARVHDGLSKSTGHFTYQTNHFFKPETDFVPAVQLVLELLRNHFFAPLGESMAVHPDLPPLKLP